MELEQIKKQIKGLQPQVYQGLDQVFYQLNLDSRYEQLTYFLNNKDKVILLGSNKIQSIKVALEFSKLNTQTEMCNKFKKQDKTIQKFQNLPINESFFVKDFKLVEYQLGEYEFSQSEVKSEFINLVNRLKIECCDNKDRQSILQITPILKTTNLKKLTTVFQTVKNFEFIDKIYAEISKVLSLTHLDFILYQSEVNLQIILERIASLLLLEDLGINLSSVNVSSKSLYDFIQGLQGLERLKSFKIYLDDIDLNQNENGDDRLYFLNSLSKLKHLENLEIKLFSFKLIPENYESFSNLILDHSKLQSLKLNLYGNQIGCSGIKNISQGISKLQNLKRLDLTFCYGEINDEGIIILGNSVSQCLQIQYIYLQLSQNQIGNDGFIQFGEKISNLKNLTEFEIFSSVNQISSQGLTLFTQSIMKCPNLINFVFCSTFNNFRVQAIQQSLETILKNKKLIKVYLDFSNVTEEQYDSAPLKGALKKMFLNKYCIEAEIYL
ncbi:hypothetical protein TTHERM_00301850 (macronuclear) [Tetrahymena thermophila SB210]|uniref:Kinase domain protein n=1 Tax=Tetrahymena thermophila (strain SB210) TaxID=312017 RepID=I7MM87_TETTS|nr:hypothetical protein TTHERM_00301850 [Tetrahymena thermophila SB210]EAS04368.2 hypothetical protein TTHERM_00301850 [Tetrahymena thermophila SB210]|eukprot:XP_001024613.2 hypothetical protein TTHERM_00301850 [Tetrahymena thermophila SB210]